MAQDNLPLDLGLVFDDGSGDDFEAQLAKATEGVDTSDGAWIPDIPTQDVKTDNFMKPAVDHRTTDEKIAEVFRVASAQRSTYFGLLEFCQLPKSLTEVDDFVKDAQRYNRSVLNGFHISGILHRAGALAKVNEYGEPFEDYVNEPELIIIDGEQFLKPRPPAEAYFMTTDEGNDYLEANSREVRLAPVLAEHPEHLPIFKRVLTMLAENPDGITVKEFSAAIDDDPIVKTKPRFYAAHFLERLERCEAVVWAEPWRITDFGRTVLETHLADVTDPGMPVAR